MDTSIARATGSPIATRAVADQPMNRRLLLGRSLPRWPDFSLALTLSSSPGPSRRFRVSGAFIGAHAIGQGTVIWVLISEIFPNQYRAAGQSLGSATHWIFAALITTFFPAVVSAFPPGYIFLFFCGMMVLQLVWVRTMVPETKGVPLEDIQRQLGVQV